MVALQIAIVLSLIGTISAFIFPLEYKVDKQGEEQLQSGNVMKVFEQIKANQANLQKDMEKVQIQIEKYSDIFQLVKSNNCFKLKPIRKTIQFVVQNSAKLFSKQQFNVYSSAIEVLGFSWYLHARTDKKGFLSVYLNAKPLNCFNGHYRIEVEYRISVLNAFRGKDLVKVSDGQVYEKGHSGWGWHMAEFEDLLDATKGFLRPDGSIEVEADFTIKSSTLDHLI